MTDALMRPIISINGTSPDALIQQRIDARESLRAVMARMDALAPNGRDYIGQHDAYQRDLAIYRRRFATLDALYNELGDEALAIQEHAP